MVDRGAEGERAIRLLTQPVVGVAQQAMDRAAARDVGEEGVPEVEDDEANRATAPGPQLTRSIVADEPEAIAAVVEKALELESSRAVILTGGTGVAPRDRTPESVEPILERGIPGFGELFRALSYEEIGSAALLSRATAGIARGCVLFVLPGSRGARSTKWIIWIIFVIIHSPVSMIESLQFNIMGI